MTLAGNAARSVKRSFRKSMLLQKDGLEAMVIAKLADLWTGQVLGQIRVERAGQSVRFLARLDTDTLLILSKLR